MAASVNKAILIGNLGRDPEVRYTPSGTAFANFSVATTDNWTNRDGEKESRTEWHRVVAWGRLAEICGEYLSKGRLVYIEGRIQTREWEDQEGNKRQTTEIVAANMQMLSSPRDTNRSFSNQTGSHQAGSRQTGRASSKESDTGSIGDDIPF